MRINVQRGGWLAWPLVALLVACGAGGGPDVGDSAAAIEPTTLGADAAHGSELDPPAVAGAFAPEWAVVDSRAETSAPFLTWIEPIPETDGKSHRVRSARLSPAGWSPPVTVIEGDQFFANWADFPAAVQAADGTLFVHWLEKNGDETYAYGPQMARSTDDGVTWQRLGPLHDDTTETEHGFVSWLAEDAGLRAFWLDGRAMAEDGPMAIRTATIATDRAVEAGPPANTVLDDRICECCSTGAARTDTGAVVAYRDRSAEEVRDIYLVRQLKGAPETWSEPVRVAEDNWRIPGCPVNGPAVAARGATVAVAWFTGGEPGPRVQLARSGDGGASFDAPVVIDGDRPLGRVDLALDADGSALVSWLAVSPADTARAEIRLARMPASATEPEPTQILATTSSARASGFPRLLRHGGALYLAWVDLAEDRAQSRVRVRRL